ncbi:universal stress protein [Saccharothrix coeruleofusca]|uniref:Universal stress protein n=1 Tax=Saccharothrix coeruleofusca TaxID=33919 RepID=A0A918EDM2_9PSEU|nr:universal stress protein [Saccharothrix coeruleofusca]GGP52048.1 universal stress protein [Saccharothrix coeruleofusca]
MTGPIVVGVDGSHAALAAVRWAAVEAARHGVPLRLVHAYDPPTRSYPQIVLVAQDLRRTAEQRGGSLLAESQRAARAAAADVPLTTELVPAGPVEALVRQSRRGRLVVLGSTGPRAGASAVAVTEHAACPVVVVRGLGTEDGPVVVGVDGSPASERAVEFAFEEASLHGVPLTAVIARTGEAEPASRAEERRLLAERLAGWPEKYPDVRVERLVLRDPPVRALLGVARGARLLVVGSRGLGEAVGAPLGSTSRALVHHAPCPLAVVRPSQEAR